MKNKPVRIVRLNKKYIYTPHKKEKTHDKSSQERGKR
jgi:hypothetical protein